MIWWQGFNSDSQWRQISMGPNTWFQIPFLWTEGDRHNPGEEATPLSHPCVMEAHQHDQEAGNLLLALPWLGGRVAPYIHKTSTLR